MAIGNNMMYTLVNDAIYNIETQCKDYNQDIITKESMRLKTRMKNLGYPKPKRREAILEFNNYFANLNSN